MHVYIGVVYGCFAYESTATADCAVLFYLSMNRTTLSGYSGTCLHGFAAAAL